MPIKYNYEVSVSDNKAKLNKDIFLFRGNRNIHYYFSIKGARFTFSKENENLLESSNAIYAAITVIKPNGVEVANAIAPVEDGLIHLKVTEDLIDEEVEVGDFDLVFDLFDDNEGAVTIPKIKGQFHVQERPCTTSIGTLSGNVNVVNQAVVDLAIATQENEQLIVVDDDGKYVKTTWVKGDKISVERLNKIEEGIEKNSTQYKDIAKKVENIGQGGTVTANLYIRKVNANEVFTLDAELPKTFTVTNNLANSTNSNSNTTVTEGNSYTATITPNTNYAISSITVTMNGIDVTNDVVSGNNINISNVTGNIVINVVTLSTLIPCTSITLDKSTLSFIDKTSQTLIATVQPSNTDDTVVWSSNHEDIASVIGGVVTAKKTGSCIITATCGNQSATCSVTVELPVVNYTVTNNLTECTSNNSATFIQEGNSYTATITPTEGYSINSTSITMGGTDITSSSYNNGNINISNVTGNIVITITATQTVTLVTDGLKKSIYDVTSKTTVDNSDNSYFDINTNFTVFAKVVRRDSTSNGAVLLAGEGSPIGLQITYEYKVQVNFSGTNSNGSTVYPVGTYTLPSDMFRNAEDKIYIAFVVNNKTAKLYVNNAEVAFNRAINLNQIVTQTFKNLTIGNSNKTTTWLYYDKALTTDELTQNYMALGGVE